MNEKSLKFVFILYIYSFDQSSHLFQLKSTKNQFISIDLGKNRLYYGQIGERNDYDRYDCTKWIRIENTLVHL